MDIPVYLIDTIYTRFSAGHAHLVGKICHLTGRIYLLYVIKCISDLNHSCNKR